jgi:VWFA-related protein
VPHILGIETAFVGLAAQKVLLKPEGERGHPIERDPMRMHASPSVEPLRRRIAERRPCRKAPIRSGKTKALTRICSLIINTFFIACALLGQVQPAPGPQTNSGRKGTRSVPLSTASQGTIHVASPLVVVPFTVIAPSGNFVYDLDASEVQVTDNGARQQITHFSMATQPTSAVIVVQADRKAARYLGSVRPLGPLFSNLLLGSKGRAAVLSYSGTISLLQAFSSDPSILSEALKEIKGKGSKARLNDALAQAIQMLAHQNKAERRVIIVFSDGSDRGSATHGAEVVRAACDANVQIYGLRFQPAKEAFENGEAELSKVIYPAESPPGGPASVHGGQPVINFVPVGILAMKMMRAQLRKNRLATYAVYSGGMVYTPLETHSFQDTLQQIALDINSEYFLTYVPDTLKQEGFHRIEVGVSRPRLKVHTRSGYFYGVPAT